MARYKIWDKQETIYVLAPDKTGKSVFTPAEWMAKFPWTGIPGVKVVLSAGAVNGASCDNFDRLVAVYKRAGAAITDGMTDEEALAAIESFQDNPPAPEPSPEERMAAAMEAQLMNGMEDVE
jgi:hypothetical protein